MMIPGQFSASTIGKRKIQAFCTKNVTAYFSRIKGIGGIKNNVQFLKGEILNVFKGIQQRN